MELTCEMCGRTVASVEDAIEAGWYPDFWDGDLYCEGPVCWECAEQYLALDPSGEMVLCVD